MRRRDLFIAAGWVAVGLTSLGFWAPGRAYLEKAATGGMAGETWESQGLPRQDRPPDPLAVPALLRVGLATDLPQIRLPCCDAQATAQLGGDETLTLVSPILVEPAPGAVRSGHLRLQVAALRDETQAQDLARRLARETGEEADALFDAGSGLYRVRVGRYGSRQEAEAAQRRLLSLGADSPWIVSEGGGLTEPALRITQGNRAYILPGRWLRIAGASDGGVRVNGRRYRGDLLLYLNDRGTLNLINEVSLEDYLRGVVPREMGPSLYPHLEALKAQAVAARTYTLYNLGEFASEGYDICATPRCQVYGGMEAEHPVTDQAIAETAGEVLLFEGELVDALYSSTCGGHTEDVSVVFPLKIRPYLRGVPCLEAGVVRLSGDLPRGTPFAAGLIQRLLPPTGSPDPHLDLAARLEHLAFLAGIPIPRDRLASLDRREIQRFVASVFDLALDARLFVAPEEIPYLLESPPEDWTAEDKRRAAYLMKSGLLTGPPDETLSAAEREEMLFRLGQLLGLIRNEEATFFALAGDTLALRRGEERMERRLPESFATFRRLGARVVAGDLVLVPGDRLWLYSAGEDLLAIVQEIHPEGVAYDRTSPRSSWSRSHGHGELATLVERHYPGLGFRGLEILTRGASGRVGRVRLHGRNGQSMEVEGLAIRWTLDLPDTLFTVKRLEPRDREPVWLFRGKGWGHGVGMCQVGAYGMALRGHGYREILAHYYSGVTLGRITLVAGEP